MSVINHNLISKWILGLSIESSSKHLLHVLKVYADKHGKCFPSLNTLTKDTSMLKQAVLIHLNKLIEQGIITKIVRVTSKGTKTSNLYKINCEFYINCDEDSINLGSVINTLGWCDNHPTPGVINTLPIDTLNIPTITNHITKKSIKKKNGSVRFDEFYAAYPRKEAKATALASWQKHGLDALADIIIADVHDRKARHEQWSEPKYIPLPATYLNQRRWEDAITEKQTGANNGRARPAEICHQAAEGAEQRLMAKFISDFGVQKRIEH